MVLIFFHHAFLISGFYSACPADFSVRRYSSSRAITFSIAAFPGAPIVFLISTQVFMLIAS